jgi:hypothetical protein
MADRSNKPVEQPKPGIDQLIEQTGFNTSEQSSAESGGNNDSRIGDRRIRRTRKPNQTGQENAQASSPDGPQENVLGLEAESPKPKTKKRAPSTKRKADAVGSASVVVDMVDGLGQSLFGDQGGFQPVERALIEDPLARIIAKTDPAVMGKYADLLDPLLLGVGLVLYASRINKLINPPKVVKPAETTLSQQLRASPETDPSQPGTLRQNLTPVGGSVD